MKMFNADAKQDEFVANLLNYKRYGWYLDIGSCDSIYCSNSFYFDRELDWTGICLEINPIYNNSYSNRKRCVFLNVDATKVDYSLLLRENNFPAVIDYLSLDVDTQSLDVLNMLPLKQYQFKAITIEHDYYIYSDQYKKKQRSILKDNGYDLLFGDVYVEQHGFTQTMCAFEDWWVHLDHFDSDFIKSIKDEKLYPSQIIPKLVRRK